MQSPAIPFSVSKTTRQKRYHLVPRRTFLLRLQPKCISERNAAFVEPDSNRVCSLTEYICFLHPNAFNKETKPRPCTSNLCNQSKPYLIARSGLSKQGTNLHVQPVNSKINLALVPAHAVRLSFCSSLVKLTFSSRNFKGATTAATTKLNRRGATRSNQPHNRGRFGYLGTVVFFVFGFKVVERGDGSGTRVILSCRKTGTYPSEV